MTVMECLTSMTPTQDEINRTPQHVRDYIRELERTLINTLKLNHEQK